MSGPRRIQTIGYAGPVRKLRTSRTDCDKALDNMHQYCLYTTQVTYSRNFNTNNPSTQLTPIIEYYCYLGKPRLQIWTRSVCATKMYQDPDFC
ncbi:hypothetical protein NDU88_001226 [Pleurodeles waltl]|uniref:Uncharacterized protein n=1 Tax=Pleurodeles waltl TaxID=8319 RepID=A0AAV7TI27_PLEWA|nr:hypothetical protein NDU88_001226 [Pleurodeles waltl]